jgi:hypothetical protein
MTTNAIRLMFVPLFLAIVLIGCVAQRSNDTSKTTRNATMPSTTPAPEAKSTDGIQAKISGVWYLDAEQTYNSEENIRIYRNDIAMAYGVSAGEAANIATELIPKIIEVNSGGSIDFDFDSNRYTAYAKTLELQPFSFERSLSVVRSHNNSITLALSPGTFHDGTQVPPTTLKFTLDVGSDGREVLISEMTNGFKSYHYRTL